MTPATLRKLGLAVWGPPWAKELARALGRGPQTVFNWRSGKHRMSRKMHHQILEVAKLHSKARHKDVLQMVATVKNRPITGCITRTLKPRIKQPIPPWKFDPQQLVETRQFFAKHARPQAFHVKQTENTAAPQQVTEVTPQTPQPTPLEARPREKTAGWVVETGGR